MSRVLQWTIAESGGVYGYEDGGFGDLTPDPDGADRIFKLHANQNFEPDCQIELYYSDAGRTEDRWLTAFGQDWRYTKVSSGRWANAEAVLHDAIVAAVGTTVEVTLWDDGVIPPTGPEPNTTFGPVSTNDDPSVTAWQWEESADGNSWANVGTILTDISGADTNTLEVNSAPIEADQTQVRCRATSAKEPTGVVSHSATLTVQA